MITTGKKIYMVGIKGVGMTALALIYKKLANHIIGSDIGTVFPTDRILKENNIPIKGGFTPRNITDDIDLVVTTGAHGGMTNPEVEEAINKGIEVLTHGQALGGLMDDFKTTISVCGAHGKTTTSALAAYVLYNSTLKGAHLVGTAEFSSLTGGDYWGNDYFVSEADEYSNSPGTDPTPRFMFQHPDYIVCTNIDFDHPDRYKDLYDVQQSYKKFFTTQNQDRKGILIYCGDDDVSVDASQDVPSESKYSFGFSEKCDLLLSDYGVRENKSYFTASFKGKDLGEFNLYIPGRHNVLNTGAVILLAHLLDLDIDNTRTTLSHFTGSSRRFEEIFIGNDIYLYDDYAHHPKEIAAVIEAARSRFPQHRVILIFQPHTYSRTKMLAERFIEALSEADRSYVLDVFASAREKETQAVYSSEQLIEQARLESKTNIEYLSSSNLSLLKDVIKRGDIVITAGAGDIYKYHSELVNIIAHAG